MRKLIVCSILLLASLSMPVGAVQLNDQNQSKTESAATVAAKVHMYVMPNCGYCEKARQYFRDQQISWRESDITSNEASLAEFKAKGGQGTPLIEIGAHKIVGFQADAINAALKD